MISMHVSEAGPIIEPLGIACRGGPVNGPYAAGALLTARRILDERGIPISRIYAISGSTPAAAMAAIGREDRVCSIWARLQPQDIIDVTGSWWDKAWTIDRLIRKESIFPSEGLEQLIKNNIPADELFSPGSIPLSVMTVDYHTGDPIIFDTRNSAFRQVIHQGILGSMALTPFLHLQVIWCGPTDNPGLFPKRRGPQDIPVVLMDGGYRDNLMIEQACRDGIKTLLVVDINGLRVAPPATYAWAHWSAPLQRAFHTLITTNDQRDLYGATRVNEELDIRNRLALLADTLQGDAKTKATRAKLEELVARMDTGRLELGKKHHIKVHLVSDEKNVIPFDFASFKPWEVEHLISTGHAAAKRALEKLV